MADENSLLLVSASRSGYDVVPSQDDPEESRLNHRQHRPASRFSYLSMGSSRYSGCTPVILAGVGVAIGVLSFVPLLGTQRSLRSGLSTSGLPLLGDAWRGVPLLGKSKHGKSGKGSKAKKNDVLSDAYDCDADPNYSKNTLKRAYDMPYAALFRDTRGQKKFEASDVTIVGDEVYSVCDSSWAISKFTRDLTPFSAENVQIGDPDRVPDEDSGYEAIFAHEGLFYVVRESVYHADHDHEDGSDDDDVDGDDKAGDYHAIIEELELGEDDYTVVRECQSEFVFEGDSKGFEGAVGFPDADGTLYIMGLCEGNHCSEKKKNDVGNGRVVLMKKKPNPEDGSCLWETVRVVNIPESAAFLDYSAIDITANGRVAIASQEQSAVWLGHSTGIVDGIIDPDAFEFVDDSSALQFPKDGGCHTVYCNVEGIHFINDELLMAVSDKMKSKGRQNFRCQEKDQSVHTFVIP